MSKKSRLHRPNPKTLWIGDRQAAGQPQNNYIKKLSMMRLPIKAGAVTKVNIIHDDGCSIFAGGFCDCNPDIKPE